MHGTDHAKSILEGCDLSKILLRAEPHEPTLSHDLDILECLGVVDSIAELLSHFVELLEFFTEGVVFLRLGGGEHLDGGALLGAAS